MEEMIPLFDLNFGQEEREAVLATLDSKWISMGPKVKEFESGLQTELNIKHGVAVNNCTAALALSLGIAGIQPGDEVLVPSLTFVATANAVQQVGAIPIFVDITSLNDWTICTEDLKSKINHKTKAIIPMHYAGYLCDMIEIRKIADENSLVIIEDGAHSPTGHREGILPGQLGDLLCLSFFSNKNLTTGEGGMVLTNNAVLAEKARLGRAHGITTSSYERSLGKEFYDVESWGWNFRMSDINAAIGVAQLKKLPEDQANRKVLVKLYRELLQGSSFQIPFEGFQGESANYILPCLLPSHIDRSMLREYMSSFKIQTSMHYPPAHLFAHYQKEGRVHLPITEEVGKRLLTLPLFTMMSEAQVRRVCDALLNYAMDRN